ARAHRRGHMHLHRPLPVVGERECAWRPNQACAVDAVLAVRTGYALRPCGSRVALRPVLAVRAGYALRPRCAGVARPPLRTGGSCVALQTLRASRSGIALRPLRAERTLRALRTGRSGRTLRAGLAPTDLGRVGRTRFRRRCPDGDVADGAALQTAGVGVVG